MESNFFVLGAVISIAFGLIEVIKALVGRWSSIGADTRSELERERFDVLRRSVDAGFAGLLTELKGLRSDMKADLNILHQARKSDLRDIMQAINDKI